MDDKAGAPEKSSILIQSKDAGLPAKAINSVLYDLVLMLLIPEAVSNHNALKRNNKECHEARVEGVHTGIVLRMP